MKSMASMGGFVVNIKIGIHVVAYKISLNISYIYAWEHRLHRCLVDKAQCLLFFFYCSFGRFRIFYSSCCGTVKNDI